MQIEGTIALVTGANRGIGKAFADALLERGAKKVYAAVRDITTISDADPRLVPVQVDVTDADRVAAVARELDDVELVINNAGTALLGTPLDVTDAALIATTQAFAPVLAQNGGGAFVNVLSVVPWIGNPLGSAYAASKSAAWNFTNSARVQLKGQGTAVVGVHISFVAPSAVATSGLDALEAGEPEATVDEWSRQIKSGLSDDHNLVYPQVEQEFAARIG